MNILRSGLNLVLVSLFFLAFSACQKEEIMPDKIGEQSFTVSIPQNTVSETRAAAAADYGEGNSVNRCILEIYFGEDLYKRYVAKVENGGEIKFEGLSLPASQTYDFVFWADCATEISPTPATGEMFEDKVYKTTNTGGLQNITENAPFEGNSDERDAFFYHEQYKVEGSFTKSAELVRPFGLLTIKADDLDQVKATGNEALTPVGYSISFTGMPDTFNALTGQTSITGTGEDAGKVYYYSDGFAKDDGTISMDLLWAEASEASLADFSVSFYNSSGTVVVTNESFRNIPIRRNYKTNVRGNLITKSGDVNVSITEDFAQGGYDQTVTEVNTVSEIADAISGGATNIVVKTAPDNDATIEIPKVFSSGEGDVVITVPASDKTVTVQEGSGSSNAPASLHINAPTTGTLSINMPGSTVSVEGNYNKVVAQAAEKTIVSEGSALSSLDLQKGNVEIYGNVTDMTLADGCKVELYAVSDNATFLKAANLASENRCEKIVLGEDIECNSDINIAGELDLNNKSLTMSQTDMTVKSGNSLSVSNGAINSTMNMSHYSVMSVEENGSLLLEDVYFESTGVPVYPSGDASSVTIRNSTITGGAYAVTTNASERHSLTITLENSAFSALSPILMNVPGTLNMKNCTVSGQMHGVIVRGGSATVEDCRISLNYPDSNAEQMAHYFDSQDWGSGNTVNLAAMTIGNKGNGYQYPTEVTLINTQLNVEGANASYFPALYAYANQGDGLGVTLRYNAQCVFSKSPVFASGNITVNGNYNPWDGVSTEAVTPNAAGEYEISTPAQLAWLAQQVNGGGNFAGQTVLLAEDIYLGGHEWTPVGNGSRLGSVAAGNQFQGIFDGGGHTIHDLKISQTQGADYATGFFGVVKDGTVKNLKFENADINVENSEMAAVAIGMLSGSSALAENIEVISGSVTAGRGNAGIVGRMTKSGTIRNCINRADITGLSSGGNTGGIVGAAYYTETGQTMAIENCSNYGSIKGIYGVGGIAGLCAANVTGCTNEGEVYGAGASIGGIVAEQQNAGNIRNCENRGKVTNNSTAYGTGGIVGWVRYSGATGSYPAKNIIEVSGNKNYAAVDGGNDAGGIVGTVYNYGEITDNENYAPSLDGATFVAGIVGNAQFTEDPAGMDDPDMVNVKGNLSTTPLSAMTGGSCKDEFVYINEQDAVTEEDNTYSPAGE